MIRRDGENEGLEVLANLVAQATKTLPELVQRRDKLQAELTQVNQKVQALVQYISAFSRPGAPPVVIPIPGGGHMQIGPGGVTQTMPNAQAMGGGPSIMGAGGLHPAMMAALNQAMNMPVSPAAPAPAQTTPSGRAPKGMVYRHVDELLASGGKYSLRTLRDEIRRRFGILYGTSSIHRAVSAGVAEKRIKLDGNMYSKA